MDVGILSNHIKYVCILLVFLLLFLLSLLHDSQQIDMTFIVVNKFRLCLFLKSTEEKEKKN